MHTALSRNTVKKEMIKALIFDMGGVLVDLDIEGSKKAFKESLGYYDIDEIIDACHQKGIYVQEDRSGRIVARLDSRSGRPGDVPHPRGYSSI